MRRRKRSEQSLARRGTWGKSWYFFRRCIGKIRQAGRQEKMELLKHLDAVGKCAESKGRRSHSVLCPPLSAVRLLLPISLPTCDSSKADKANVPAEYSGSSSLPTSSAGEQTLRRKDFESYKKSQGSTKSTRLRETKQGREFTTTRLKKGREER